MSAQLALDFDVEIAPPVARRPSKDELAAEAAAKAEDDHARERARHRRSIGDARAHWKVGMATQLPIFSTVLDSEQRYTQMLPGVIESIADDLAAVRIFAAPEYGYTIDNYPLHGKLAIDVPITELGKYVLCAELVRLVGEGRLAAGDPELAARIRARQTIGESA